MREERQEENKVGRGREGERSVVKANRPPDKTHQGSLLTPIQEKQQIIGERDRERRQPDTPKTETPRRTERRDDSSPSRQSRKEGGRVRE